MTGITQPQLFVLAGPNGAGKTTVARVLLPKTLGIKQFVNADNIAAGLSPFAPETTAIQAGRLMLRRIRELFEARESFGFETTLAGRGFASLLREMRDAGYLINVIYIWLSSADLAVARVADRVRHGGHGVPEETIRRRYTRSIVNFFDVYRSVADMWTLCDNSVNDLVIVAHGTINGDSEVLDAESFVRIEQSVNSARRIS